MIDLENYVSSFDSLSIMNKLTRLELVSTLINNKNELNIILFLTSLKQLIIGADINEDLLVNISYLSNLRSLQLNTFQLVLNRTVSSFASLKYLKHLVIQNSVISDKGNIKYFKEITNLKSLSFVGVTFPDNFFHFIPTSLNHLIMCDIPQNCLNENSIGLLTNLKNLEIIEFKPITLDNTFLRLISELPNLVELIVKDQSRAPANFDRLSSSTKLEKLIIFDCNIDISTKFSNFISLKTMELRNVSIPSRTFQGLTNIKNLQSFKIRDSNFHLDWDRHFEVEFSKLTKLTRLSLLNISNMQGKTLEWYFRFSHLDDLKFTIL